MGGGGFSREKGRPWRYKRGKGKHAQESWTFISTLQPDRAHARTNETKPISRLGRCAPPPNLRYVIYPPAPLWGTMAVKSRVESYNPGSLVILLS